MKNLLAGLIKESDKFQYLYKPTLFKLKDKKDKEEFEKILSDHPNLNMFDEIQHQSQTQELIKYQNTNLVFNKEQLYKKANAPKRICSELTLVDFDFLGLSNFDTIRKSGQ